MAGNRDYGLDNLLVLDGDRYFIDEQGELEVVFSVTRVPQSGAKPHGIDYSIVLLNSNGDRLVGFDNAHAIGRRSVTYDHRHIGLRVMRYEFVDALTLIEDFWKEVDKHLR